MEFQCPLHTNDLLTAYKFPISNFGGIIHQARICFKERAGVDFVEVGEARFIARAIDVVSAGRLILIFAADDGHAVDGAAGHAGGRSGRAGWASGRAQGGRRGRGGRV